MGKVIAFSIFKGGTGKTTSAVSVAAALAELGKKVLLVDLDQQASATRHLGIDPEEQNPNLFHVFMKQAPASTAIHETRYGFDILPAHQLLAAIEESLEPGDETLLREMIAGIVPDYDLVILDSPPGKAMLAINALASADEVVIPLQSERPALDGVADLLRFIQEIVWEKYNPNLKIRGILPTMYRRGTKHSPGVIKKARELWGDKVLDEIVHTVEFPRAFSLGKPITHHKPQHNGSRAYRRLAEALIK